VRRIPNVLALAMLLTGTAFAVGTHGLAGGAIALGFMVTGLLVWLPFYIFRMMGAGDVKLFAAACAWLASFTQLFLAALATAIVGGVLAIVWAVSQRRTIPIVGSILTRVRFKVPVLVDSQRAKVPYG